MEMEINKRYYTKDFTQLEFIAFIKEAKNKGVKFIQLQGKTFGNIMFESFDYNNFTNCIEGINIFNSPLKHLRFHQIEVFYFQKMKYKLEYLSDRKNGLMERIMARVMYNFDIAEILFVNARGETSSIIINLKEYIISNKNIWLKFEDKLNRFYIGNNASKPDSILYIKVFNYNMSYSKEKIVNSLNTTYNQEDNIFNSIDYDEIKKEIQLSQDNKPMNGLVQVDFRKKINTLKSDAEELRSCLESKENTFNNVRKNIVFDLWDTIKEFDESTSYLFYKDEILIHILETIDYLKSFYVYWNLYVLENFLKNRGYYAVELYRIFGREESLRLISSQLNFQLDWKKIIQTLNQYSKKELQNILTYDIIRAVYKEFESIDKLAKKEIKNKLQSVFESLGINFKVYQYTISYFYKVSPSNSKTPAVYRIKNRLY